MCDQIAILARNIVKKYDDAKILDNLSMTVEKGIIYGLLGASGCGKTTLLNCIIGRRSFDGGDIRTMGVRPGTKNSGIPGPLLGYMPQELALIFEYTVKETIYFFGRLANMQDEMIHARFYHLSRLLELPPNTRFVGDCSGGEQRRISLAAAMVQEPELLILDEPTVGVDSVLRDKIWKYLYSQVSNGTTVVLTTHYIEECQGAHKVGLMRNGKLLAEESPESIMSACGVYSLEQAFLKLCLDQDNNQSIHQVRSIECADVSKGESSTSSLMETFDIQDYRSEDLKDPRTTTSYTEPSTFLGINKMRLHALLHKNYIQFIRHPMTFILFLTFPVFQNIFFLYAIGGDLKDLRLGIINDELDCLHYDGNTSVILDSNGLDCKFNDLSCRFMEYLNDPMINLATYNSTDEAIEAAQHGGVIGYLYFPSNFSITLEERVKDAVIIDSTLEKGSIQVRLDMSSRAIGWNLKYRLIELMLNFQNDLYKECSWDERLGKMPMNVSYLYGEKEDAFVMFMIPGLILTYGFFFGMTVSSMLIVSEKFEGVWYRSIAVGVTTKEISLSHLIFHISLVSLQALTPNIITFHVFRFTYEGAFFDLLLISMLQNICGLIFGFWISVFSESPMQAHYFSVAITFIFSLLSGFLWPVEGLPQSFQIVAKCLPSTMPVQAMRSMIKKGYSFWHTDVMLANLVPLVWIVLLVSSSLWHLNRLK